MVSRRPLELDRSAEMANLRKGDVITIGIRPENFDDNAAWKIPAKIGVIESLGRETLLYAKADAVETLDPDANDAMFAIQKSNQFVGQVGDSIGLGVPQDAVFLFDDRGRTIRYPVIS